MAIFNSVLAAPASIVDGGVHGFSVMYAIPDLRHGNLDTETIFHSNHENKEENRSSYSDRNALIG